MAIGRALVRDPKLFLFDEPLSNLDAKLRDEMRTEIKKLHQRLGTTIIYVTHDQIEAMTLGTKVAVMKDGVVEQLADPETLYNLPSSVYVARFVGSPAMNIVPGTMLRKDGQAMVSVAASGNDAFVIGPLSVSPATLEMYDGRTVLVGMRPEHFRAAESGFTVNVDVVEPTGPDDLAFFTFGGTEVIARLAPKSVRPGIPGVLSVEHSKTVLFNPETERRLE